METDQTNLTYDLGILTLFDSKPLNFKCDLTNSAFNQKLSEQSFENIKRIVQSLYAIKVQKDEALEAIPDEHQVIDFSQSQYDITLPEVKTVFPRHKKIPEQKAKTRWEKFAQDKGIEKRKRSRMVWDEITKTWVPRWGAKSIKKIQDSVDIIRNAKPGEDPNEDPFEKKSKLKRLQKEKQKFNELRNKMEAKGIYKQGDVPNTIKNIQNKKHKDKNATSKSLQIAQSSTASMGLFDKKAHKEEQPLKKKRKNSTVTNFSNAKDENRRDLDILQQVIKNQGSNRVSK